MLYSYSHALLASMNFILFFKNIFLFQTTSNERGVAFWLWIDGILDLIKRCLLNIWNDG